MPCSVNAQFPRRTQPRKARRPSYKKSGELGEPQQHQLKGPLHGIVNWKAPLAWSQESSSTPRRFGGVWTAVWLPIIGESGTRRQHVATRRRRETAMALNFVKEKICMFVVIKPHLQVTTWKPLQLRWKMHLQFSRGKNGRYFYRGVFLHNAQAPVTQWEKLLDTRGVSIALPALAAL